MKKSLLNIFQGEILFWYKKTNNNNNKKRERKKKRRKRKRKNRLERSEKKRRRRPTGKEACSCSWSRLFLSLKLFLSLSINIIKFQIQNAFPILSLLRWLAVTALLPFHLCSVLRVFEYTIEIIRPKSNYQNSR